MKTKVALQGALGVGLSVCGTAAKCVRRQGQYGGV